MASMLAGLGGAAGGSAAGGSAGAGMGGAGLGGMMGMFGGGDTNQEGSNIHTQKVMGIDVPDAFRNFSENMSSNIPNSFAGLLESGGGGGRGETPSLTDAFSKQLGGLQKSPSDMKMENDLDSIKAATSKINPDMSGPINKKYPTMPNKNYGLSLME